MKLHNLNGPQIDESIPAIGDAVTKAGMLPPVARWVATPPSTAAASMAMASADFFQRDDDLSPCGLDCVMQSTGGEGPECVL